MRVFILLAILFAGIPVAEAETYHLDRRHTVIQFSWNHNGLADMSGRFTAFDGVFDLDFDDVRNSAVRFTIETDSVWTGVAALDDDMRSERLFDAAAYPTIEFVSTGVRQTGLDRGEVYGDLTIRDRTHPVTLYVTLNYLGDHPFAGGNDAFAGARAAGISAVARVNRSRYGMRMGIPFVSDEIRIRIDAELARFPGELPDSWRD